MADSINTIQIVIAATDKASRTIKGATSDLNIMGKVTNVVQTAIASLGIVAGTGLVKELSAMGGEAIRAKTSLSFLMGGAEEATETLKELRVATGNEVSDIALLQQSTELMVSGLADTRKEMTRLIGDAEAMGDVMGMDATQAIDALSRALLYQTPRALRQFGLNVENVQRRQAELLATQRDLTKEQAFTEAALLEVESVLGRMSAEDGAIYDTVDAMSRLNTAITNLKTSAGESLFPTLANWADALNEWLFQSNERQQMADLRAEVIATSDSYGEMAQRLRQVAEEHGYAVKEVGFLTDIMIDTPEEPWIMTLGEWMEAHERDYANYTDYVAEAKRALQETDRTAASMLDYIETRAGAEMAIQQMVEAGFVKSRVEWWLGKIDPLAREVGRLGNSFGELRRKELLATLDALGSVDQEAGRLTTGFGELSDAVSGYGDAMSTSFLDAETNLRGLAKAVEDMLPEFSKAYSVLGTPEGVTHTAGGEKADVTGMASRTAGERLLADLRGIGTAALPGFREMIGAEPVRSFKRQAEEVYSSWNEARQEVDFTYASISAIPERFKSNLESNFDEAAEQAAAIVGYLDQLKSRYRVAIDFSSPSAGGGAMPAGQTTAGSDLTTPQTRGGAVTESEQTVLSGGGAGANLVGSPTRVNNFNLTVNTTRELFSVQHEFAVMSALGG